MQPPSAPAPSPIGNLLSNYGYVAFLALIPVFAVPMYLHLLGAAGWGGVALCLTLQGFLFSLDMALGPLMLRDVARAAGAAKAPWEYRRFLRIYASVAIAVFAIGIILLALLVEYRAQALPVDTLWALRLALLQFLFQFSNYAAIGYWNGLERQHEANLRLTAFTLVKHLLALFLLATWRASASTYMAAFAFVAAVEFSLNHRRVRRERPQSPAGASPRRHDALGFAAAALLGLAATQIDRGYLSLTLPSADYGLYYLIGVPMLTLFSLQMPIQRAYLPRLATTATPRRVAVAILKVTCLLLVVPSLSLAAFPELALGLWLHDAELAKKGAPAFRLLMLAVAMHALFAPVALMLLNQHRNALIGALNALGLIVQITLLVWLTPRLGMLAGAVAWLACGLIQLASMPAIWRAFGRADASAMQGFTRM